MINSINPNMTFLWRNVLLQGMLFVMIVFITTFNDSALAAQSIIPQPQASDAITQDSAEMDKEQRRALMEKAILEEKYKMNTEARDNENKQRANGKIFGFDLALGSFLTMLWAIISLFIAAQFFPDKGSLETKPKKSNNKISARIFYGSAALVPLMLLWVSIATGYVSWWLTFALSSLIYWFMSWIFKRIENNSLQAG